MPVGQLLALRNMKKGVTVLTPDPREPKNYLEFQAAGDPAGGDTHYVSEETAILPAVAKGIQNGIFELEEDALNGPAATAFQRQKEAARRAQEQAERAIQDTIVRTENRDIGAHDCIGPSTKGGKVCGTQVPMSDEAIKDSPPLCPMHKNLEREFIPNQVFNPDKPDEPVTHWHRATLGPVERQEQ